MGKDAPTEQIVTSTGKRFRKVQEGGRTVYKEQSADGGRWTYTSGQAWAAAAQNRKQHGGKTEAFDERWEPDKMVDIPVPNGDTASVPHAKSSIIGRMVSGEETAPNTIEINGTVYTRNQLQQAWGEASPDWSGQVVKY